MIKLPEPVAMHDGGSFVWLADWLPTSDVSYYTESQMRQAIKDAYEDAAKVCDTMNKYQNPHYCAESIRNLKEQVE